MVQMEDVKGQLVVFPQAIKQMEERGGVGTARDGNQDAIARAQHVVLFNETANFWQKILAQGRPPAAFT